MDGINNVRNETYLAQLYTICGCTSRHMRKDVIQMRYITGPVECSLHISNKKEKKF